MTLGVVCQEMRLYGDELKNRNFYMHNYGGDFFLGRMLWDYKIGW